MKDKKKDGEGSGRPRGSRKNIVGRYGTEQTLATAVYGPVSVCVCFARRKASRVVGVAGGFEFVCLGVLSTFEFPSRHLR